MTNNEAIAVLRTKYPSGSIYYSNKGRFSHTNMTICVCFNSYGKEYRYNGSYESVLIHLGLLNAPVIDNKPVDESKNMFIQAIKHSNNL